MRALGGDHPTGPPGAQRRLARRYDATSRKVNNATARSWNGNSGIPPPALVVVVLLWLVGVVWAEVVGIVEVLVVLG